MTTALVAHAPHGSNWCKDPGQIIRNRASGFALWIKKLENERFRWPLKMEDDIIKLSSKQLAWLLDGLDIAALKAHKSLTFEPNLDDTF